MRPLFIVLLLGLIPALTCKGQEIAFNNGPELSQNDSLYSVRKLFHTNVYKNQIKLDKGGFARYLSSSKKWSRKNKIANIILPAGPVISAGGIYLVYDAIKGVPMVYRHEGQDYPYVVRSLPKLLGGLALFVGGLSLVESANETKMNATNWYNQELGKELNKKKEGLSIRLGLSTDGAVSLTANF
ncbi:hypothetical protein [Jiulongibacter sp. NS-SX5]|uniref:hypothetical protein n=1 Tax=Jiulongibacter sp. NS-SX5 TaxID=3463854 RepID=UPI0040597F8B